MTTSQFQQSSLNLDEKSIYQDQLHKVFDPIFAELDGIIRRYAVFNIFFITVCTVEIILLLMFFAILAQSFILAVSLAAVFFTFFAYYTLRTYLQTKKPEQLRLLRDRYISSFKALVNDQESQPDHFILLANAYCKLANRLHGKEYDYYSPPSWLSFLASFFERISCSAHWQDLHIMKELLLQEAVKEHLKRVKCHPTSLEAHAGLANAYVMLSGLYIDPRKLEGYDDDRWIPADKYGEEFEEKFRNIAERAIEEFKILSEYAPDDPWVHSQLAYSYHDLRMPLEEIREYEMIQKLMPEDRDNLFKLGILYFQQGLNAKGLRVYEELKKAHYKRAESLIKYYGSYIKID